MKLCYRSTRRLELLLIIVNDSDIAPVKYRDQLNPKNHVQGYTPLLFTLEKREKFV